MTSAVTDELGSVSVLVTVARQELVVSAISLVVFTGASLDIARSVGVSIILRAGSVITNCETAVAACPTLSITVKLVETVADSVGVP